jgi:hypothetical protein
LPELTVFIPVGHQSIMLLQAPLFEGNALDEATNKSCQDLKLATKRLNTISAQDFLILLLSPFHFLKFRPKLQHQHHVQFGNASVPSLCVLNHSSSEQNTGHTNISAEPSALVLLLLWCSIQYFPPSPS